MKNINSYKFYYLLVVFILIKLSLNLFNKIHNLLNKILNIENYII